MACTCAPSRPRCAHGPSPQVHQFGKPERNTFDFAAARLAQIAAASADTPARAPARAAVPAADAPGCAASVGGIWMVGDNPAADVRGANNAGPRWRSVLVRSGVFQPAAGEENDATDPADFVVDDMPAAVRLALAMEGLPPLD